VDDRVPYSADEEKPARERPRQPRMRLRPCHAFECDEGVCLIDTERLTARFLDEETSRALVEFSSNSSTRVAPGVEKALSDADLILFGVKSGESPSRIKPPPIRSIALFVTQVCNQRCVYCYGDGGSFGSEGEMSRSTARGAVDWLIEQSGKGGKLCIAFFGGEPLLNFPLIEDIVGYAGERGDKSGKEFEFCISTNGSLLDDEKIAFFVDHGFYVTVGFDGPRDIQDSQRPYKNGEGTYESVLPGISKLIEVSPGGVACRATAWVGADPVRMRETLLDLGFSRVVIAPAAPSLFEGNSRGTEPAPYAEMLSMFEEEAKTLLNSTKNRDTETLRRLRRSHLLCDLLGRFINRRKRHLPCRAARQYVAVSSAGDVYLCHRFVGMDEYRLGSIFNGGLQRDQYQKGILHLSETCANCFAKYLCAGGCMQENAGSTGSAFVPNEASCRLVRGTTELAAYLTCRLDEEDKAYLVEQKIISPRRACPVDF